MNEESRAAARIVVEYDAQWASEFQEIATLLRGALGTLMKEIHHVGSTSIPGMIAKPTLDIDVELTPQTDVNQATAVLVTLGYEYEGERGIADRHAYGAISSAVPLSKHRASWMSHHLYVCPHDSAELFRHLRFRDELRRDIRLRDEYISLKQEALKRATGVRQIYVDEKARLGKDFFLKVLSRSPGPREGDR